MMTPLRHLILAIGAILLSSSLAMAAAPTITNNTLPGGSLGINYGVQLNTTVGNYPYTFLVISGTLPAGLALSTPGSDAAFIGGTPTTLGTSNFTVRVTDKFGAATTKALSIVIGTPIVISRSMPSAAVGSPYLYAVPVTGGTPPYTWSADWNYHTGNLYAEFTLNPVSGVISGTPLHINYTDSFVLLVTDSVGATGGSLTSIRIEPEVFITTTSLPPGSVGRAYLESVAATGGTTPLEFSLIAGTIPLGLSLNPSTGLISGMPTTLGTSNFTVRVSDRFGAAKTRTMSIPIGPPLITTTITTLPGGAVGNAYLQTVAATGGTPPYAWSIVYSGTLPAGLTLNPSTGVISGTPINANVKSLFSLRVTDSVGVFDTNEFSITIATAVAITTSSLPTGTVGTTYAQTVAVTGGTVPRSFSVTSGILPPGLAFNASTGAIIGTPTASGSFNFVVQVSDGDGVKATQALSIMITPTLTITTTSLQGGNTNAPFARTITATGGTPPFIWSLMAGSLPAGVTLNAATGVLSGTPTVETNSFIIVQVADSLGATFSQPYQITITSEPTITTASLPSSTVGRPYSQTLATTGGTAPLTWSVTVGTLPSGLNLNAGTGAITGSSTAAGTSNFTAQVTDLAGAVTTKALSIVIAVVPSITTTSLPGGTLGTAYSQTLAATGGTAPLSWSLTAGTLPAGLTLNAATGAITGIPTATGTANFTVQVTDAVGGTATKALTISIASGLTITTTSLPGGTVGTAYTRPVASAGGTAPLTWSLSAGTLPAGLTLNTSSGVITGTPTTAAVSNFTVQAADSAGATASQAFSVTIAAAMSITASLPGGTLNTPYAQTVTVTGGTAPLVWSVALGTLPAGLGLNSSTGALNGTPSAVGTSNFTIQVSDAAGANTSKVFSLTIASTLTITTASLPGGTLGTAYSQTLGVAGGTVPYTWSLTAGTLPAGVTLNASSGAITGTPTTAGTSNFTVKVLDTAGAFVTKALSITIAPALSITTTALPDGSTGQAYATTLVQSGGTAPFVWSVTVGTLPAGLTLNSGTGVISGTLSVVGSSAFTVQVLDSAAATATKALSITFAAAPTITTASLGGGTVGIAYSQTAAASSGTPGYIWSLFSGALPAGLILTAGTGAIAGTPTTAGTSNFNLRVMDSLGAIDTKAVSIVIAAVPTVTTTSLPGGTLGTAYSQTLTATGGTAPLAWSLTAGGLPAGLGLNAASGTITGTPTTGGPSTFTVRVTDSLGATATQTLAIGISAAPVLISVNKTGSGNGTITTNPAGINCGPTCSTSSFTSGQIVTLAATPAAGSIFSGWSGDADCIDGSVSVSGSTSCTARFDLPQSSSMQVRGDFDGDGKTDVAIFRPSSGEWFIRLSTKGYSAAASTYFVWGLLGDIPIVGDFDGDRKTDIAVYRPSTGEWLIRLSTQAYSAVNIAYFQWGGAGDVPVPGDFDGDRKTDIAVYRPSTGEWFIRLSTLGFSATANAYFQWGAIGDVPVPGDFDGDSKTDIAVYRPSTEEWFIRLSTKGYSAAASSYFIWGGAGNVPIPGDFDGDSKADIAKYRPSTGEWFIRLSTLGYSDTTIGYFQWGAPNDRPILADYDGDGKTEATIYRPSTGEWFIRFSTQGYSTVTNGYLLWGFGDDLPLPR